MAASEVSHAAGHPAAGEFARVLAQIAPVGIVQSDADGQVVYANDRFCAMTGLTAEEALGAGWADSLHSDDIERVTQEWERAATNGAELRTDCRLRTADGGEIWVHVASTPLPGPDGEPVGYLAAVTNISDRKLAEAERERLLAAVQRTRTAELAARELAEVAQERLVEQNAALLERDEHRRQFLATASHELSTPLASIISFCELIKGEPGISGQTGQAVGVIERNARRLLRVVGDLLLITRIEAGGLPLDTGPVSVPELVADVATSNAPEAAKQGVRLEVSAGDGPRLRGDQERLHQALDNLLSNAIKFTARKPVPGNGDGDGVVRITATHDDRAWQVEVADSGIGIPPDELGGIFDRFIRASNAKAASLPGTGLGLSVVKAVAELHDGRVEVDSAEGRGTTFRVYLPMSR